jgi:hypothetical protein
MDAWLHHGGKPTNLALYHYPGIPYFLACGLAWEISKMFIPISGDTFVHTFFLNIDLYWIVQAIMSGLLFSLGVAVFAVYARRINIFLAVSFAFLMTVNLSQYNLILFYEMSSETFALPLTGAFLIITRSIFNAESLPELYWRVFVMGLFCALGYMNKLPYLVYSCAFFPVLAILGFRMRKSAPVIICTLCFMAGIVFLLVIVRAVFGDGAFDFIEMHKAIFLQSHGAKKVILELASFLREARLILADYYILRGFSLLCLVLFLVYLKKRVFDVNWPLIAVIIFCLLASFAGVAKRTNHVAHYYSSHYALLPLTFFPFLLYEFVAPVLEKIKLRNYMTIGLIIAALLAIAPSIAAGMNRLDLTLQRRVALKNTEAMFNSLPYDNNEVIYFAYGSQAFFPVSAAMAMEVAYGAQFDRKAEFRKIFPDSKIQTSLTWDGNKDNIAYLVLGEAYFVQNTANNGFFYNVGFEPIKDFIFTDKDEVIYFTDIPTSRDCTKQDTRPLLIKLHKPR